jgi:hypothetical protein
LPYLRRDRGKIRSGNEIRFFKQELSAFFHGFFQGFRLDLGKCREMIVFGLILPTFEASSFLKHLDSGVAAKYCHDPIIKLSFKLSFS